MPRYTAWMLDLILSIVILAALALMAGGVYLLRQGLRKQGLLMIVLSLVMLANAAIWLIPTQSGDSPREQAAAAAVD